MKRSAGFTLFEVIIALLLIALAAAAAAPMLMGGLGANDPRLVAGELADTFRRARAAAIADNVDYLVAFDADARRYSVAGEPPQTVPTNLRVTLQAAVAETLESGIRRVRFYPDGTSTGGAVFVADGRAAYRVAIDWLTGRVWVDEASDMPR